MRVALIRGSSLGKGAFREMFGLSMPPLGLASLAAVMLRDKHDAILIDALSKDLDINRVAEIIDSWKAEVVGVTICASPYYKFATDLAKKVREKNRSTLLIAGGYHATFGYSQLLKNDYDFAVLSEGEETFSELINTLNHGDDVVTVKGIAFRKDGEIIRTESRPLIKSLDSLPIPAFELFDKTVCQAEIFGPNSYLATMETSRGCPYNCEFCSVTAMWGRCWRFKSTKRVLDEIQLLKSLGYNWVFLIDDNFITDIIAKERKLLFKEMKNRGLNSLNLIAQMRADLAAKNPSIIKDAASAGLKLAFLGLESGSHTVLKRMNKGVDTDTIIEGIRILHKNGIITHGGFVLGAPYESRTDLKKTFRFADQLRMVGLDSAQFSIYTPLLGTEAFSKALKNKRLLTLDWKLYDCLHPVIKTQIGPFWLFLESGIGQAAFFIRKWISDNCARTKHSYDDYSNLIQTVTQFVSKNLAKYTKETLHMPLNALRIWSNLKKDRTSTKDMLEIFNYKTIS